MNERGFAESTQWAIVMPAVLSLILGLVQTGVWLHGRTIAAQAAAVAADLRVAAGADPSRADLAARDLAHRGGLADVEITTSLRSGLAVVTVTGRVPVFFDFGQSQIREQAVMPLERAGAS